MMSWFPEAKDAQEHFFSGKGYDWSRVVAEQEYRMEQMVGIPPVSFEIKRPKQIAWGPCAKSGLQMGAWFDADRNMLFAVIRNVGDKPVQYSDYVLGYGERGDMGLALWGRKGKTSQWTQLPFRSVAQPWSKSARAGKQNIHTIQPKAWMMPAATSSGNFPKIQSSAIPKPPITDTTGYTFCLSLDLFDMPTAIGSTPEIQIRQPLGNDGSTDTWAGILTCDIPIKRPN